MAASSGAPGFFPLFGVLFVIVAVVGGISGLAKASGYQSAEQDYQRQREHLLSKLRND